MFIGKQPLHRGNVAKLLLIYGPDAILGHSSAHFLVGKHILRVLLKYTSSFKSKITIRLFRCLMFFKLYPTCRSTLIFNNAIRFIAIFFQIA